jgi:hypothetical protein
MARIQFVYCADDEELLALLGERVRSSCRGGCFAVRPSFVPRGVPRER